MRRVPVSTTTLLESILWSQEHVVLENELLSSRTKGKKCRLQLMQEMYCYDITYFEYDGKFHKCLMPRENPRMYVV